MGLHRNNSRDSRTVRAEVNECGSNDDTLPHCRGIRSGCVSLISAMIIAAMLVSPDGVLCTVACAQELLSSAATAIHRRATGAPSATEASGVARKVKLLYLYSVKDGKLQQSVVPRDSLERGEPVKVDGYVCGVVAFSEQEMAISVDGQVMSKIRKNGDGSFLVNRFGTLKPEDFSIVRSDRSYYGEVIEKGRGGAFLKGGYSFFPDVVGDSVADGDSFQITFGLDGKSVSLPVEQHGYMNVRKVSLNSDPNGGGLNFRYLGSRLPKLEQEVHDFDGRLQSIAFGVNHVKKILGADLIAKVNIVDYGDVYNAVTSKYGNDMWVYSTAFRKEPVNELKTIAEHETLHRFVDRIGFTSDSDLRELFSDLREFEDCSYERFLTMTTGQSPVEKPSAHSVGHGIFFSFINEKNFLEGMKGGHSQANIDEFCASFVHSLMYVDRLEENLNRAIDFNASEQPRHLTMQEKALVLGDYIRTVLAMQKSIDSPGSYGGIAADRIDSLLKYALRKATDIRARLQMTNAV